MKTENLLLFAVCFLFCNIKALAETSEDNLTEEFFNAAMELDANTEPAADAAKTQAASKAAEQSMAAEQVGENAMTSGNNVLHTVKDFLMNLVDKIQTAGSEISSKLGDVFGTNPVISKIILGVILALASVVVIVVFVLIAKKFVFKKKNLQAFDEEEEYEDDDTIEEIDENDALRQDLDEFDDEEYEDDNITQEEPVNTASVANTPQITRVPVANAEEIEKHITVVLQTPQTKDGAIKNFIKITQGF